MSLRDAVQSIAEEMDKEAADLTETNSAGAAYAAMSLRGYAKNLRMALKASEGGPEAKAPPYRPGQEILAEERRRIARATEEVGKAAKLEEQLFATGTLVGGPGDGDMVPISGMPVGAKTAVCGGVYQLGPGGKLNYLEEETKRMVEKAKGGGT